MCSIGRDEEITFLKSALQAFHIGKLTVLELLQEEQVVCFRWKVNVKQTDTFQNYTPNNQDLIFIGTNLYYFEDDIIIEKKQDSNIIEQLQSTTTKRTEPNQYSLMIDSKPNIILKNLEELYHHSLTHREIQCLSLWAWSRSAKEISRHLDISARTIEHHLDHARQKLIINNKSDFYELTHSNQTLQLFLSLGWHLWHK